MLSTSFLGSFLILGVLYLSRDLLTGEGRRPLLRFLVLVLAWITDFGGKPALVAVASAPPKRFAGGGYWEAMKGDMSGWFEVRMDGPGRHHYRLFCLLDYEAKDEDKPLLVVVDGRDKPFRTTLSDADYAAVRRLGVEYRKRNPRSVV